MEAQTYFKERIYKLLNSDPKPIFDHFRNIGIAVALALGAGALRSFNFENNSWYLNDIAMVCSYVTLVVATLLLIINISFARISINMFFFKKTKFYGLRQKIGSALVLYTYTGVLFALTVMYTFNAANVKIEQFNEQQAEAKKSYVNIDKMTKTVQRLEEENIDLRSEVSRLKKENESLSSHISQFNKSIQPTVDAPAD